MIEKGGEEAQQDKIFVFSIFFASRLLFFFMTRLKDLGRI